MRIHAAKVVVAGLLFVGCDSPTEIMDFRRDAGPQPECLGVEPGEVACEGTMALQCDATGHVSNRVDCGVNGQLCVAGVGCAMCEPNRIRCDGELVLRCNPEGTAETEGETCDAAAGVHCSPAGCQPLCAQAVTARSYLGCAYYAVPTTNSFLDSVFSFAVAIANPQLVVAEVTIEGGAGVRETRTIAPGALELVTLPWIEALRSPVVAGDHLSVRAPVPAYRIASSVPVTVHQFNPLSFSEPVACSDEPMGGQCFSFTNDASLLLPTHALTGSYLLMSRPAQLLYSGASRLASPGFVSIVGAGEGPVPVTVRTHAYIARGIDAVMPRHVPGDTFTFTLAPGEIVQLVTEVPTNCPVTAEMEDVNAYCPLGADYDLTGTEVVSDGQIAVFAGHNCSFVPFNRWACDHLEEQIFPSEALGMSVVAPMSLQQRGEPHLLRIVSAANNNEITFTPAREDAPPITLNRGEFTEIAMRVPTRVTGTAPLLAARFFVGQDYNGLGTSGRGASGDPSMGLLVPDEQWRRQYIFLTPDTYTSTFVDIIASAEARVELDAQVVGSFRAAEGTGYSIARVPLRAGIHRITSTFPVGVQVYGYAPYTSYLVPGGLDLIEISDPL
jgi:hypothetical protein